MSLDPLDTSGLLCPMPVLRTRKALRSLVVGELLTVIATDPAAARDIPAFCTATGQSLVSVESQDGRFIFQICKMAD